MEVVHFLSQTPNFLFPCFSSSPQTMASPGCSMLPEKQFQCTVCRQVFTDPVTTPCGHNFCRACLETAWAGGAEACRCPACDKPFDPRPEMSVNAAFKELADAFRRMASAPPARSAEPGEAACDVCAAAAASPWVGALKSCLVCLTSYCEAHLEPHRRVATLMVHRLIEPAADLQARLCREHDRLLEMFCRDEQEPVCRFCTETRHRGHRAVGVEDESRERKVEKAPAGGGGALDAIKVNIGGVRITGVNIKSYFFL